MDNSNAGLGEKLLKTIFYFIEYHSTRYGTQPLQIVNFSLFIILLFAIIFFIIPDNLDESILIDKLIPKLSKENVKIERNRHIKIKPVQFLICVYFSFRIFTTFGLGDWSPHKYYTKLFVIVESTLGFFSLGLFIASYGNQMLR